MEIVETGWETKGYLDIPVDPTLDLVREIDKLKRGKECSAIGTLLSGQ